MNIKPLGENLVLKKLEEKKEEETTKSGIVLPDSGDDKQEAIAEVTAIGSKISEDDEKSKEIKIGDKVIYSKYSGTSIEIDDVEYLIVEFDDCLAVIEE